MQIPSYPTHVRAPDPTPYPVKNTSLLVVTPTSVSPTPAWKTIRHRLLPPRQLWLSALPGLLHPSPTSSSFPQDAQGQHSEITGLGSGPVLLDDNLLLSLSLSLSLHLSLSLSPTPLRLTFTHHLTFIRKWIHCG